MRNLKKDTLRNMVCKTCSNELIKALIIYSAYQGINLLQRAHHRFFGNKRKKKEVILF